VTRLPISPFISLPRCFRTDAIDCSETNNGASAVCRPEQDVYYHIKGSVRRQRQARRAVTLLDIVATIFATAYCAAQAGLLIGPASVQGPTKIAAFATAAAWLAAVVLAYTVGGLSPGALGPFPINLLPFTLLLAILFGGWVFVPQFRNALLSVPLPALVAVHAGRVAGVFFLILYFEGRLSAPFAPVAAIGDMITGAVALLLVLLLALGIKVPRLWLGVWNAFGMLDLLTAISLATLSAPGTSFRVFTEGPGTLVMGTLPWIFVPAMLVPVDLLVHVAIMAKLKSAPRAIGTLAAAG